MLDGWSLHYWGKLIHYANIAIGLTLATTWLSAHDVQPKDHLRSFFKKARVFLFIFLSSLAFENCLLYAANVEKENIITRSIEKFSNDSIQGVFLLDSVHKCEVQALKLLLSSDDTVKLAKQDMSGKTDSCLKRIDGDIICLNRMLKKLDEGNNEFNMSNSFTDLEKHLFNAYTAPVRQGIKTTVNSLKSTQFQLKLLQARVDSLKLAEVPKRISTKDM